VDSHRPAGQRERLSNRLDELLPRSERIEIPAASHRMQEENPTATNEAILDFLDRRAGMLRFRRRAQRTAARRLLLPPHLDLAA
jgi:hypothetical protein